jgi:hypothetical protein
MAKAKYKLEIELIPATIWFSSLHNIYKEQGKASKWNAIKKNLFATEGRRCWICGVEDSRLEAHEFWQYDDANHIQKLTAIHHICSLCHKIKHFGFWCRTADGTSLLAKMNLSEDDLITHFCKVNGTTTADFELHLSESLDRWKSRSEHKWTQDFGEFDPKKP